MNPRRMIWNSSFISDKKRIEWYPPFWLMRIKVLELSPCWRKVRIKLPHSWIATNAGGSLFGGFQACLADPIAAMSCVKMFPGYSVWTRTLDLDFQTPGKTDLELRLSILSAKEDEIRHQLATKRRSTPQFEYGYYLNDGTLCTRIRATVAIRPLGYRKPDMNRRRNKTE